MNLVDRPMGYSLGPDGRPVSWLRGRSLRFVLVAELMQRPQATVAELVSILAEHGYELGGRASKVISDALRWEIRRGRVVRLRRGCYRYVGAPPATARRIRIFGARCRAWVTALQRRSERLPTSPDPRCYPWRAALPPPETPWNNLGWLWVS